MLKTRARPTGERIAHFVTTRAPVARLRPRRSFASDVARPRKGIIKTLPDDAAAAAADAVARARSPTRHTFLYGEAYYRERGVKHTGDAGDHEAKVASLLSSRRRTPGVPRYATCLENKIRDVRREPSFRAQRH